MADATRHSIPSYPWGRALTVRDLNTERGFVFQYPPFPALTSLAEGAKPPQEPIGLYFHIPFCGYRCSYCYYAISLKDNDEETSRYVTNVFKEVEQSRGGRKFVHRPSTIFVGGGTPTYLSPQQLETFCQKITTHFDTTEVREFTFESDPSSITNDKIRVLKEFRVNRISIGIQTFSDRINQISERGHTRVQSMRAIECVRKEGINNINLDIICGLAGDTLETFRETIAQIRAIKPEHLTV